MDILSMMGLEGCMAALGPDGSVLETQEGTFWLARGLACSQPWEMCFGRGQNWTTP